MNVTDILSEYIKPTYPNVMRWYNELDSTYKIIPLKYRGETIGLAITKGIKLCTFVIVNEYRNRGFGTYFINKLDVKYVKSKNEKLKSFFSRNNVLFIVDKR